MEWMWHQFAHHLVLIAMFNQWCLHISVHLAFYFVLEWVVCMPSGVYFYVHLVNSAHIRAPCILLCGKTGCMNRFIVDCRRYLFWFHIINQSGNALLASQSEEVTSSQFQFVHIPHWTISTFYSSHWLVNFNILWLQLLLVTLFQFPFLKINSWLCYRKPHRTIIWPYLKSDMPELY